MRGSKGEKVSIRGPKGILPRLVVIICFERMLPCMTFLSIAWIAKYPIDHYCSFTTTGNDQTFVNDDLIPGITSIFHRAPHFPACPAIRPHKYIFPNPMTVLPLECECGEELMLPTMIKIGVLIRYA